MAVQSHPSQEQLQAFAEGRLDGGALTALESHLLACADCWEVIEAARPGHPLLGLLKGLPEQVRKPLLAGGEAAACPPAHGEPAPPPELRGHPRYEIVELVGQGGMGVVWKARHLLMNRAVALKVIRPALLQSPSAVARFLHEVEAAGKLSHPNIVSAHDAEEVRGVHFLVMEFVDGIDLARLVRERGPLPVAEACGYARQVAFALQHADERGLVHRDIKPHNLMRTLEGVVKVLDFGLAAFLATREEAAEQGALSTPDRSVTRLGDGCGTPDYISPEQVRDARGVDIRADIYSLGCTLYHLLAGQPPFAGSGYTKVAGHLERAPPPLSEMRAGLPPALLGVLGKMLAKDPRKRFRTPSEVAEALAPFAAGEQATPTRRLSRRAWLAAAVVGLGAAGGWRLYLGRVPQARLLRRLEGHTDGIHSVVFSPDGRAVLSASKDGTLRLWSAESGEEVRRFQGQEGVPWPVAFLPDGKRAVSGTTKGELWLWDVETGEVIRRYEGTGELIVSLKVSPDGGRILGASGPLCVWDTGTEKLSRLADGGVSGAFCVTFLGQGRQALCGSSGDERVRWWDLETRQLIHRFPQHPHAPEALAASAGERRLLVACNNRIAVLWDLADRREVERFTLPYRPYRVWPHAEGFRIVLNDDQGTLYVWEWPGQRELVRLVSEGGKVQWGCDLSGDGRLMVTGSQDAVVRVWELPWGLS